MLVRGKAPLRVSFCGGGTDVSPYCDEHGGVVLSSTINLYAYATIEERNDNLVNIRSLDYDTTIKYDVRAEIALDGRLDLIKAILAELVKDQKGLNLFIHNDAPPGSGLGSSGTIGSMIVGMLVQTQGLNMDRNEVAEKAIHIERDILKNPGGRQDQYAAVYGGFSFMEFHADRTVVYQLRIDRAVIRELEYHLLLVYTHKTHHSGGLIQEQVDRYKRAEKDHIEALHELKHLTYEMREALVQGNVRRIGDLLHEAWVNKVRMNPYVTTDYVNELYETARKMGARGGKILGAGGGGYLLLFCPFQKKHEIAKKVTEMGAVVVNFSFEKEGLQVWSTRKNNIGLPSSSYVLDE